MRFSALLKKELRECLPWMLLAGIVFIAVTSVLLQTETYNENINYRYSRLSPGTVISSYSLTFRPAMFLTGPWLFFLSIGLGLVLGIRQFWIPNFTRTWPFLLHRSVSRNTILAAKLVAASITFVISLVPVWVGIYWYATRPDVFAVPPRFRFFIEGWIFIMLGLVTYLGTALSALSTAKWYSTKIFGIVFAGFIIIIFAQFTLVGLLGVITFSTAILLSQIFQRFLRREF
ncbi:MAG: hypothetical protein ACYS3N_11330 [Planctomycetota bacterium]